MYGITEILGVPNYGLAIILITILIKIALFPLTQKQMKSMRKMQEIQPETKYLQEKYKGEPEILQKKTMELYKEKGVSPLGGCLPLLLQMPIFIAFYQSLIKFDFAVAEHASFLGIDNIGQSVSYYIGQGDIIPIYLPILAAVTTYLQQRISMVDTNDPTQKSMLYMMPIFMAWIVLKMPAGLPIYWVMFNTLGILQQLYVNWHSKQAKIDNNSSLTIDGGVEEKATQASSEEDKASDTGSQAGREKGGKNNNGSSRDRKKRKKR
ncbi:inner membrane protein translocase component yidc, short form oxai-like [hydrocarbon metagenome]|uniref:Inner membrane protein translocase component yidc, short form oxai-like n=1 Tax=hydrocarbon metagenome TaxID=938273 RepID=A0A0W8E2B9_9ZZZZ